MMCRDGGWEVQRDLRKMKGKKAGGGIGPPGLGANQCQWASGA